MKWSVCKPAFLLALCLPVGLLLSACGTTKKLLNSYTPGPADLARQQVFQKMDADGDRQITLAQAKAWIEETIRKNDKNRNGEMDLSEVPAEFLYANRKAQSFIDAYDRNGDNRLSVTEAATQVNVMFQHDQNADGVLTRDEIEQPVRSAPVAVQAPKPGE